MEAARCIRDRHWRGFLWYAARAKRGAGKARIREEQAGLVAGRGTSQLVRVRIAGCGGRWLRGADAGARWCVDGKRH